MKGVLRIVAESPVAQLGLGRQTKICYFRKAITYMSQAEQKTLLKNMHERTAKATKSKKAAIAYLAELGMLNKDGSHSKVYRRLCIKSKAA